MLFFTSVVLLINYSIFGIVQCRNRKKGRFSCFYCCCRYEWFISGVYVYVYYRWTSECLCENCWIGKEVNECVRVRACERDVDVDIYMSVLLLLLFDSQISVFIPHCAVLGVPEEYRKSHWSSSMIVRKRTCSYYSFYSFCWLYWVVTT